MTAFCEQAGISQFYSNAKHLTDVWFRGTPHTPVTRRMEFYILSGGSFGTYANQLAVTQQKQGGADGYLLHRIFMPTELLCRKYPSLEAHKWLVPCYQLRRWFGIFSENRAEKAIREMSLLRTMDTSSTSEIEKMLRDNDTL